MRSRFALALATFLSATTANECRRDFTINPNDNITQLFDSCTTIIGNIEVGRGFDGDITLRNVFNITGTIEFRADTIHDDSRPVVYSFNAPDLTSLGGLYVMDFSVYELYMRNLRTVGSISVYVNEYALNLDLDELVEADSISISRAVSTVKLGALKTVNDALTISYHAANSSSDEPTGMNNGGRIDLPSLESAGALSLGGAWKDPSDFGMILDMEKMEEPYELDLPMLRSVDDQLLLSGNVKEIHTPRLTNFTSINITSTANLDCDAFIADIESTTEYPTDGSSVTCTFAKSGGLSKGAKIAIGVVVPIVVIAIIAAIALMWTRKKSGRESRARMELRGVNTGTIVPLPVERERGFAGQGGSERPLTPPPPYSSHGR
ncbi:hypothetical protein BJX66DRAFT_134892 [Aspergillus keveii]|uniref:Uncharacterized protein n=1 Tax=Aspergillus keveii TaxID=714993 RepID=A0ABR4FJ32_9EURO